MTRISALSAALIGALALTCAPAAFAQASTDTATVKPGVYKVESYHTQIGFSVSHFGFTPFSGFFSGASGALTIDAGAPSASKLEISAPISSVLTTVPKLDEELKGPQWFDAAQFPNATFKSTAITLTGKDTATVTGDLTLHGVTKPITLKARFVGAGVNPIDKAYTVGFEAVGTIKRTEFGVKTYAPAIGDEVTLTLVGAFALQN